MASVRSAVVPLPDRYKSQQGRSEVKPGKMGDRKGFFLFCLCFISLMFLIGTKKLQ